MMEADMGNREAASQVEGARQPQTSALTIPGRPLEERTGRLRRQSSIFLSLVLCATLFEALPASGQVSSDQFGKLPAAFEPNPGQADARVKYLTRSRGALL